MERRKAVKNTYVKPEIEIVELLAKEPVAAGGSVGWGSDPDVDTDI